MSQAFQKTILTDRLVEIFGDDSQKERHAIGALPVEEFLDGRIRPWSFTGLDEYASLRRFKPWEYKTKEDKFKVIEQDHEKASLSAEQFESWKHLQKVCPAIEPLPGIDVVRTCTLREKHIFVEGKLVEIYPLVLVVITFSDPQKRCDSVIIRRRVEL